MIGLILIATGGPRYTKFVAPLVESAQKFFPPHEVVLFTDDWPRTRLNNCESYYEAGRGYTFFQPNLGWPRATLMRYHAMNQAEQILRGYSHVFYCDIDMLMESPIHAKEICSDGITAVIHPGYPDAFERDPRSTAYIADSPTYYQGCFVGGRTDAFLKMTQQLAANIDADDAKGVMALWHDESHLNRYLRDHPPTIALSPEYAFPAPHYLKTPERWLKGRSLDGFVPKIRHIEKTDQGEWKNK